MPRGTSAWAMEPHFLAQRLGRDLDALTGARMLMETSADPDLTAAMLRLIVERGKAASERARALLAEIPASDRGGGE